MKLFDFIFFIFIFYPSVSISQERTWLGADDCFGNEKMIENYLPEGSGFELMSFADGTKSKCLNWTSITFNDNGIGLMVGVKERDEKYPKRGTEYTVVAFKSIDGLMWEPINAQFFNSFLNDKYEAPINRFYLTSSGDTFHLLYKKGNLSSSQRWYDSKDGIEWEERKYVSVNYGGIFPYHVNTGQNIIPASYGSPGSKLGLFKKSGASWTLLDPYPNRITLFNGTNVDDIITFPVYFGNKIKYHGVENFSFIKNDLYYKRSDIFNQKSSISMGQYLSFKQDPYYYKQSQSPLIPNEVHVSQKNSRVVYALFDRKLFKSTDGGVVFNFVLDHVMKVFPLCSDGTIFVVTKRKLFRSNNDGLNWIPVSECDYNSFRHSQTELAYLKNGTILAVNKKGWFGNTERVFRLKEGCGTPPKSNEKKIEFGTTVITHDRLYHPPIVDSYSTWMQRMAEAILEKAGKGIIYVYNPESGKYSKIKSLGSDPKSGEQILIFDWAKGSIEDSPGFTGSAAEALYLSLTEINTGADEIEVDNIHFIGHGRGCIVNSLVTEKIYRNKINKINIDQVTNLGPYEKSFDSGYNSEHPGLVKKLYSENNNNVQTISDRRYSGIIKWDDGDSFISFSDSYWQNNGKHYAYPIAKFVILGFVEHYLKKFRSKHEQQGTYFTALNNQLKSNLAEFEKTKDPAAQRSAFNEVISSLHELTELFNKDDLKQLGKQLGWFVRVLNLAGLYEEIVNSSFDSNPVRGSYNVDWSTYQNKTVYHNSSANLVTDYFGICDAYIESIKKSEIGKCTFNAGGNQGGYCFARLNAGEGLRTSFKGVEVKDYDLFEDLRFSNLSGESISRIRSIYNGSFDRGEGLIRVIPGWSNFGGEEEFTLPESGSVTSMLNALAGEQGDMIGVNQGEINMVIVPGANTPTRLRQNRFLVPKEAEFIGLQLKTRNVKSGVFRVNIIEYNQNGIKENNVGVHRVSTANEQHYFEVINHGDVQIDISSFQGKVISVEFVLESASDIRNVEYPKFIIDNVRLLRSKRIIASERKDDVIPKFSNQHDSSMANQSENDSADKDVKNLNSELEEKLFEAIKILSDPIQSVNKRLSSVNDYRPLFAENATVEIIGEKSMEVLDIQNAINYLERIAFYQKKRSIVVLGGIIDEEGKVTKLRVIEKS